MTGTGDARNMPLGGREPLIRGAARPHRRGTPLARGVALVRAWFPAIVVLALFAGAAFVVPTLAPVATTDDWAYSRSVQILIEEGRLEIFPVVAATAVFQVVWGALFGLLFGPSLGVTRLSTVVIVALGALALYGLCRQLGVSRGRGALGMATYLFNPLSFVLAFTFMTDPHFAALLVISTLGYVRGLEADRGGKWALLAGSAVAGLAFLTRQQGALIPLAMVIYLLVARRLRPDWASLRLLLRVVALPAVAVVGYYVWLRFFNDVPHVQESFFREVSDRAGWSGSWWLFRRLTFFELIYLGFFLLPIIAAALPAIRQLFSGIPTRGWLLIGAWEATLLAGVGVMWGKGYQMPYIGQFFGASGPGAPDVLGSRPRLFEADIRTAFTIVCTAASLLLAVAVGRAVRAAATPERAKAGLVLAIMLWQVIGVMPPSFHYLRRGGSLDRYLLPLLPLGICLALWLLRDVRLWTPVGWVMVAAFATIAVGGTRDYLVFMDAVWSMARDANEAGVPNDRLDAGSAWDGYHLYEYSRDNNIKSRTRDGPWWVYFYAPATDSTYIVAGKPLRGMSLVKWRTYSSWLETEPTRIFLLRKRGAPWPPSDPDNPPRSETIDPSRLREIWERANEGAER